MDLSATPTAPYQGSYEVLEAGTRVGRFVLEGLLGGGGMGVVYTAHDPDLHRSVAIKLLRPDVLVPGEDARLRREARAMARLSHENLVPIYEVGYFGDQTYIAMERIEGTNVAEWMAGRRPVGEVVAVFLQAGRGLLAAHDAGVVHRDFKPANVLLGRDGRVRVADFGLAHDGAPRRAAPPAAGSPPPFVTSDDLVVGTPAYMAPEQRRGEAVTEKSDQFSFCVSLQEALTGERPAATPSEALPRWLAPILRRGLAERPEDRWPSMAALLHALAAGRRRRRWPWLVVVAAGAAAAAVASLAPRPDPCARASDRPSTVWGEDRRAEISRAFLATGAPTAAANAGALSQAIDRWIDRWGTARGEACRSMWSLGQPVDARMRCLDRRLDELGAQVELLRQPDAAAVARAPRVIAALPGVDACDDDSPPADPGVRERVNAADTDLAAAAALEAMGRLPDSLRAVQRVIDSARDMGHAPLEAKALGRLAAMLGWNGEMEQARQAFRAGVTAAEAARDDRLKADMWRGLMFLASKRHDFEEAHALARAAEAALVRVPEDRRARPLALLRLDEASVFLDESRDDEAGRLATEAMQTLARFEHASPDVASHYLNHGAVLREQAKYVAAEAQFRTALAILEASSGEGHPLVSLTWYNIGNCLAYNGNKEGGLAAYRKALELRQRHLGPDNTLVGVSLYSVGVTLYRLRRVAEALDHLRRATALYERTTAPDSVDLGYALNYLGKVLALEGHPKEAIPILERACAIMSARRFDRSLRGGCEFVLGRAQWQTNRDPRARARLADAEAHYRAAGDAFVKAAEEVADYRRAIE